MRRLVLYYLLTLLSPIFVQGQTTTVSGTVTDTGGQAWINGTYTFSTQALGQVPLTGSLDSSGSYSRSIPHNAATSIVGDVWQVSVCPAFASGCFNSGPITIAQQTQTLNLTPGAISIKIPLIPQNIPPVIAYADAEITGGWPGFTYYNVTTSTNRQCTAVAAGLCTTWIGSNTFTSMNGRVFADTQPGADTCAKITNAEAALPASGGTVDASGFVGVQVGCASSFNVGSASQQVQLIIGQAKIFVPSTVTVFSGSSITGVAAETSSSSGFTSTIAAQGGFTSNIPLIQFQSTGGSTAKVGSRLTNLKIDCNAQTGCTGVDWGDEQDFSELHNVSIANYSGSSSTGHCVNTGGLSQIGEMENVDCAAASTATNSVGIVLGATADHWVITNVNVGVTSGAAVQQTAIQCTSCNVYHYAGHFENHVDGMLFTGGATPSASLVSGADSCCNVTNVVHISSTYTGALHAYGIKQFSAGTAVKNDLAAFNHSCTDLTLGVYSLSASSSSPQQLTTNCSTLNSNLNKLAITANGLAPPAAALAPLHIKGTNATQDLFMLEDPAVRKITLTPTASCNSGGIQFFDTTGSKQLACFGWVSPFSLQLPGGVLDLSLVSAPAGIGYMRTWGDSGDNLWHYNANNAGNQQVPEVIALTSQYTNSTTTFTNVAGGNTIQWSVKANTTYTAACHIYYQAAATGGLNIEFTGPASPTAVAYGLDDPNSPTSFNSAVATAFATSLGQAVSTSATNYDATISFSLVNGANAGTVNLLAKSSAAAQLQIQAGSFCRIQ